MRAVLAVLLILLMAPLAAAQSAGGGGNAGASVCGDASTGDRSDRDEDGLPDQWECRYFGNLKQDASGDPDDDDVDNLHEWKAETDPTKADAKPDDSDDDSDDADKDSEPRDDNATDEERSTSLAAECGREEEDDKKECVIEYCAEHEDEACDKIVQKACRDGKFNCAALIEPCARLAAGHDDDRVKAVCNTLHKVDDIRIDARHVSFDVDRIGRALLNYSVGETVLMTAIEYGEEHEDFDVDKKGSRIRFETDESRLEIHDNPTGDFWYRADDDDATLRLVLAPGASVSDAPNGLTVQVNGYVYRLAGKHLEQTEDSIILSGDARFFRTGVAAKGVDSAVVDDAIAAGKLGASVGFDKDERVQVTAFDDVGVNVSKPELISTETPLRVVVNATLDEGRTIIIDLDADELAGPDLHLAYFDLNDDGTETEVVFRQADSLEDVMDATDDGGQPEYWIVEDDDGVHVMASVPHWSTHIIQVAADFLSQPSVLIGIAAGVLGVGIGGAGMFWPRRREDHF